MDDLDPASRGFLEVMDRLDGVYVCPETVTYRGLLVGYAATYRGSRSDMPTIVQDLQYVGKFYLNMAMAEQHPLLYDYWVSRLAPRLELLKPTVFMGLPTGGVHVASALARLGGRLIHPDREVTVPKTATQREQTRLLWGRHRLNLRRGDRVVIVEDVINSLSTGSQAIELVKAVGAEPVAIASLFSYREIVRYQELPVISFETANIPQYRQDDPAVADEVTSGQVIWKPKDSWSMLISTMKGELRNLNDKDR